MKIKTYYPVLCTPNFDGGVNEIEALGFAHAHEKDNLADHNNSQVVFKDEVGNRVDVVSLSSFSQIQQAFVAIRMNVEDFDEALAELTAAGYLNLKPGNVEEATSKATMLRSPQGIMYLLCQHVK